MLICLCYWCLAQSFAGIVNLSLVDVLILMGFVSFGSVVQIPGVGGGMQVVSVLVLTELFGIRLELATAFAIYLWAITFVAIVPFGLFVALKEGLGLAQPDAGSAGRRPNEVSILQSSAR